MIAYDSPSAGPLFLLAAIVACLALWLIVVLFENGDGQ